MSDWSDSVTRVVAVAAVDFCAIVAAYESSRQLQSTCGWKHFATLVVAVIAMH